MKPEILKKNLKYFTHNKLKSVDFMSILNKEINKTNKPKKIHFHQDTRDEDEENFEEHELNEEKKTKPLFGKKKLYKKDSE